MSWLETRLGGGDPLVLPGIYDALSARMAVVEGAEAVYCGGFATCAAQHGLPDVGLLGLAEMAEAYRRIKAACRDRALVADGDTGHGGLLNVQRTVATFGSVGVAACHIEDQMAPKRCGHLDGKSVVSIEEAEARVRAAVEIAGLNGVAIIARTDAIAPLGFDEAIERANRFLDAGAAAAFIDAPQSFEQISQIPERVRGPVLYNAAPTGRSPLVSDTEAIRLGYSIIIHPIEALLDAATAARKAVRAVLGRARADQAVDFPEINEILQTSQFISRESRLAAVKD
jgi:2-methylisocitrate lyase-like PEP mutase family enzyme